MPTALLIVGFRGWLGSGAVWAGAGWPARVVQHLCLLRLVGCVVRQDLCCKGSTGTVGLWGLALMCTVWGSELWGPRLFASSYLTACRMAVCSHSRNMEEQQRSREGTPTPFSLHAVCCSTYTPHLLASIPGCVLRSVGCLGTFGLGWVVDWWVDAG